MTTARNEGQEGLVEGLERELARLEAHLRASGELQDAESLDSGPRVHVRDRDSPDAILRAVPRQSSPETVDLNVLREVETVSLYRGELYGLEEMTHRALRLDNSDPRGFFHGGPRKSLISSATRSRDSAQSVIEPSLDRDTATRYADNFFSHIHPTFPLLREATIRHAIDMMLESQTSGAEERIMMYLVLAMGAILPSQSSVLDTVNSAKCFLGAAQVRFSYDESFKTAQILLLFTLYSLFDPTTGSSWHLIDLVMQVCIVLGLHQLHAETGAAEEVEAVKVFQAAYTLDFFISTSLGLPMSTRNGDITTKCWPSWAPGSSDACDILTPQGIYSWAHELCESPNHSASNFLQAYGQHVLHESRESEDLIRRSIPSILGWHLAVQSLRRIPPGDVTTVSRDGQLLDHWKAIPKTMPALLMMPWIAGYTAFQTILLQIIICGTASDTRARLTQSLSHSNLILSALSSKFEGLRPHADFGRSVGARLTCDSVGGTTRIEFLEGSDLYEFCREALHRLGTGVE